MKENVAPDPMDLAMEKDKAMIFKHTLFEATERGSKIAARVRSAKECMDTLKGLQLSGTASNEDLRQLVYLEKWIKENASKPLADEIRKFEEAYDGFFSIVGFNRESIKFLGLIKKDAEVLSKSSDGYSA
jgi:hypothetical protein